MRFSAASTAERLLPARLALRVAPLLGRVDAALFAADERGVAGRMSLIAFAIRIVSAVIAFASQVFLARWMGSFEFGIFVLVWLTVVIVGDLSCFGFQTSVIRFIPEFREKHMLAELRGVLVASRMFALVAATAVAGSGALGIWLFADSIDSYYVVPFLLGVLCLPMIALSDVLQGIARAHSWAISALSPTFITRPILILAFMAAALLAGFAPTAQTAMIAAILATYVTTVIQLVTVTARVGRGVPGGPRKVHLRAWLVVSLPIFLVEGFYFLVTNADVLMVGFYMSPDDVAVYFATVKVLSLVHFVYFAVRAGVAQRYAQFTHGDPGRLAAFARETVSWTFWPSLLMALGLLALGKPMLMLFGPSFVAGYPLLFPLVFGVLARAAVGPCESLLTMSGNQNICALVFALTLAINIALNMLLIPQFGLWGTAIATSAAMVFEALALSFTVWRKLGIVMAILAPPQLTRERP
ncbi:lipopolysaccharide biosynthesis protein [Pseudaminobacter sp. NGMCC 1.201702]|uniref:lipopolysaccharide biosynthesis protein n=1 Tax=Pseudaminobacter sp. NGMCC 1.201702 TaxID=3391825 RepID=UPI0039F088A2